MTYEYDVVIVGGIAGLVSALDNENYESYIEDKEKNTPRTQ